MACTIEMADGTRLTALPLSEASVRAGQSIAEGGTLGRLAPDGDRSGDGTHLHISARRGALYLDPMQLLAPPVPAQVEPETAPTTVAHPVPGVTPAAVSAGAGARVVAGTHPRAGQLAPGVSLVSAGAPVLAPAVPAARSVAARPAVARMLVSQPQPAVYVAESMPVRETAAAKMPSLGPLPPLPVLAAVGGVLFGSGLLLMSRRRLAAASAVWRGVSTGGDDVAALADRC